jgi:hypothetical protein
MNQLVIKSLLVAGICASSCGAVWAGQAGGQAAMHVEQQSQRVVKGHVTDADGPIIGATVKEKGNPKMEPSQTLTATLC